MSQLEIINEEINKELSTEKVSKALLETTFKGLSVLSMKQAIMEGMMRGFVFKDFLEKNVYAIPFGQKYSLVTSIDYSRKLAMRSGLAGKSAPNYKLDESKNIESCTITVKRNVDGLVGDYTSTVYFREYTTGKNLWATKPHTMIAKVAEMHALRSAFPEEMAKVYVEEELEKENIEANDEPKIEQYETKLKECKTLEDLKTVFSSMPQVAKAKLKGLKDELKATLTK